uniref:Peptidase n=1 Tax=Clostridioides difficile TaxID=1496 RepID=A0A381IBU6_CLODI|nr:peptidase [Clostridioides difficile]
MKGQYTAMMSAVAYFAKDTNRDFAGELYVAGVVHEEIFEGVSAREISKAVQPDYVVIGESSELNLKIGQRGRGEIVVETFGKPAHSANPEKGVMQFIKWLM